MPVPSGYARGRRRWLSILQIAIASPSEHSTSCFRNRFELLNAGVRDTENQMCCVDENIRRYWGEIRLAVARRNSATTAVRSRFSWPSTK